jgi:hypothetical protein
VKLRRPTHPFLCGTTRAGKFLVKRASRRDRVRAKLKEVKTELRRRMHRSIPEQGGWLKQVVTGLFNYPCSADQWSRTVGLPPRDHPILDAHAPAPQPAVRPHVGAHDHAGRRLAPQAGKSDTLGPAIALPLNTRGGSPMPESRSYGSVRGACSNGRPLYVAA